MDDIKAIRRQLEEGLCGVLEYLPTDSKERGQSAVRWLINQFFANDQATANDLKKSSNGLKSALVGVAATLVPCESSGHGYDNALNDLIRDLRAAAEQAFVVDSCKLSRDKIPTKPSTSRFLSGFFAQQKRAPS